ncbi:hypothetical protein BCR39DRAFT_207269 [Naematelia encephala]|uniref:CCHC-type domain-containing protein n=1 Tax=Naematelia encephala TaxID=71784 RepID=A0A1Y2B0G4_9TREE|nr:hypothetical protein BCR39DRAFT_207269 [Naematelia encephala]
MESETLNKDKFPETVFSLLLGQLGSLLRKYQRPQLLSLLADEETEQEEIDRILSGELDDGEQKWIDTRLLSDSVLAKCQEEMLLDTAEARSAAADFITQYLLDDDIPKIMSLIEEDIREKIREALPEELWPQITLDSPDITPYNFFVQARDVFRASYHCSLKKLKGPPIPELSPEPPSPRPSDRLLDMELGRFSMLVDLLNDQLYSREFDPVPVGSSASRVPTEIPSSPLNNTTALAPGDLLPSSPVGSAPPPSAPTPIAGRSSRSSSSSSDSPDERDLGDRRSASPKVRNKGKQPLQERSPTPSRAPTPVQPDSCHPQSPEPDITPFNIDINIAVDQSPRRITRSRATSSTMNEDCFRCGRRGHDERTCREDTLSSGEPVIANFGVSETATNGLPPWIYYRDDRLCTRYVFNRCNQRGCPAGKHACSLCGGRHMPRECLKYLQSLNHK